MKASEHRNEISTGVTNQVCMVTTATFDTWRFHWSAGDTHEMVLTSSTYQVKRIVQAYHLCYANTFLGHKKSIDERKPFLN